MAASSSHARQIQKVYSDWSVKAAEAILAARFNEEPCTETSSYTPASFNLKVAELFNVRSEAIGRPEFFQLKTLRSFHVEVYVVTPPGVTNEEAVVATGGQSADDLGQLLERWTFTFFPAHLEGAPPALEQSNQTLIQRLNVSLRCLLCYTRLLPAHIFSRGDRSKDLRRRFRVETWPPTSKAASQELVGHDIVSLPSSVGTLRLSVAHRRDLPKNATAGVTAPFKSTTSFGAQIDDIEVQEGYFASAVMPPEGTASAGIGKLGKIAEEPEAARGCAARSSSVSDTVSVEFVKGGAHPNSSPGAASETASLGAAPCAAMVGACASVEQLRSVRPRGSSTDSVSSSLSGTSSKAVSSVADHVVFLQSTPPLAAASLCRSPPPGLITLGPQPSFSSPFASRCSSPYSTPPLPARIAVPRGTSAQSAAATVAGAIAAVTSPAAAATPPPPGRPACAGVSSKHDGDGAGCTVAELQCNRTVSAPAARELRGSGSGRTSFGGGSGSPNATVGAAPAVYGLLTAPLAAASSASGASACKETDDLSDIWAHRPPEIIGFRRSSSLGTCSRGTGSRSVSPEDTQAYGSSNAHVVISASGFRCGGAGRAGAGRDLERDLQGDQGEFCMFGMSDDDDADNEETEAGDHEMERNVVASTLSDARGDGAFAGAALSFDSEPLGLSGLETLEQEPLRPQRSPLMTSSPLIAQLNPFGTPPWAEPQSPHGIPEFELPVAAFAALSASGEIDPLDKIAADQHRASAAQEVGNSEPHSVVLDDSQTRPVDLLLVEMGDLVCRLQRKRELAIAAHEVTADELLARLAHFQEIADRIELKCVG